MSWALIAVFAVCAVPAALAVRWAWRRYVGDWFAPHPVGNWREAQVSEQAKTLFDTDKLLALAAENPTIPAPLARWTEVAIGDGDWPAAVHRSGVFLERFPDNIYGYLAGARALSKTGDYPAAEALLAKGAKKFPTHPRPLLDRAMVAQFRKDWPEAVRRWRHLQRRFPNEEQPFAWEGMALLEMGDLAAAETALANALARFPHNRDATIWYATLAHRQENWAEAAKRWAVVRQRCDDRIEGYVRGAEALRHIGCPADARDVLAQAEIIFPNHPEVKRQLAAL